jgi:hypothetical protein
VDAEVAVVLAQRVEPVDEEVRGRHDGHLDRQDPERGGSLDDASCGIRAGRPEDDVDEGVAHVDLEEPVLRRLHDLQALVCELVRDLLGVLPRDEEIRIVVRLRPAPRPDAIPADERERPAGRLEGNGDRLERLAQVVLVRFTHVSVLPVLIECAEGVTGPTCVSRPSTSSTGASPPTSTSTPAASLTP